jgi:hypothetical protein
VLAGTRGLPRDRGEEAPGWLECCSGNAAAAGAGACAATEGAPDTAAGVKSGALTDSPLLPCCWRKLLPPLGEAPGLGCGARAPKPCPGTNTGAVGGRIFGLVLPWEGRKAGAAAGGAACAGKGAPGAVAAASGWDWREAALLATFTAKTSSSFLRHQ